MEPLTSAGTERQDRNDWSWKQDNPLASEPRSAFHHRPFAGKPSTHSLRSPWLWLRVTSPGRRRSLRGRPSLLVSPPSQESSAGPRPPCIRTWLPGVSFRAGQGHRENALDPTVPSSAVVNLRGRAAVKGSNASSTKSAGSRRDEWGQR